MVASSRVTGFKSRHMDYVNNTPRIPIDPRMAWVAILDNILIPYVALSFTVGSLVALRPGPLEVSSWDPMRAMGG